MKNLRLLIAAVCLCALGLLPLTASAAETEIVLWHSYRAEEKAALEKVVAAVQQGQRRQGREGDDAGRPL